jgi:uncharacterized membrane protein (UPF0182 family)
VARDQTELGQRGSEVLYGNLLLVPVDNALLYVQPFYVVSDDQTRQLPQLRKVIATFGDEVVIEDTLQQALDSLFGETVATQERPDEPAEGDGDEAPAEPEGSAAEQAAALLAEADQLFAEADAALADGDIGAYQDNVNEGRELVAEAMELLGEGAPTTTTTEEPETSPA